MTVGRDVGPALDAFIAAIEAQTLKSSRFEVVFVDEGSVDGSLATLHAWQRRRPNLVRVFSADAMADGAARNVGLAQARGEWVSFPRPEDVVSAGYLAEIDAFLTAHPDASVVVGNRLRVDPRTGEHSRHPMHRRYGERSTLRTLDRAPKLFCDDAATAFFRVDLLRESGLGFDDHLAPEFDEGYLAAQYLLHVPSPTVGFVATAHYVDGPPRAEPPAARTARYATVPRCGLLAILREAEGRFGRPPRWLQAQVLHHLVSYLAREDTSSGEHTPLEAGPGSDLPAVLGELMQLIDVEVAEQLSSRWLKPWWREILVHSYRPGSWHTPFAIVDRFDERQHLVRVTYRFTGTRPSERFLVDGRVTKPKYGKVRGLRYFGAAALNERIAWLPVGGVRVQLEKAELDVRLEEPARETPWLSEAAIRERLAPPSLAGISSGPQPPEEPLTRVEQLTITLARTRMVRRLFADAWVLIDRLHDADDSAEHLFRYLRKKRRHINAWFVIEAGTSDYRRLRRAGYQRVVPHGSLRWKLLMLNCDQLISSHADSAIVRPPAVMRLTDQRWRSTFLQHGVLKDDLSNWLNTKNFDLFVTSTQDEYDSVAGDGTSYTYTDRETRLTGLPRFDGLLERAGQVPPERRDLILLAPTWRKWLVTPTEPGSAKWQVDTDRFLASDFAHKWFGLRDAPGLIATARRAGLQIALLLHPNLQPVLSALQLPAHVTAISFDGDAQGVFARARVLVTDYSSMSFNAAYLDRPVVYFQFDRDLVLDGGHLGRRGYFDYYTKGYGPVVTTVEEAVTEVIAAVERGPEPAPQYLERIRASFPHRDGKCCARVTDAILASGEPAT